MGYTTPQRIIDRSAAETLAGGQKVASSMSEVASLVKKQKEDQDKIFFYFSIPIINYVFI